MEASFVGEIFKIPERGGIKGTKLQIHRQFLMKYVINNENKSNGLTLLNATYTSIGRGSFFED